MNVGDVIFVHGNGPLSRSIEYFDGGPFSHVAIAMPHDCVLESQYFVNTRIIPNPYDDVTVVPLSLTKEQQDALVVASFKYLEDKYDMRQIFGILLHDLFRLKTNDTWNSPRQLICSELVVDVLTDVGFFDAEEHAIFKDLTPNALYDALIQKGEM
jgi:hypothetical protein